jgi:hypothetical protein
LGLDADQGERQDEDAEDQGLSNRGRDHAASVVFAGFPFRGALASPIIT